MLLPFCQFFHAAFALQKTVSRLQQCPIAKAAVHWIELFKEANMLSKRMRTLLGVALLPFLATSLAAQQAAPKMDKTRAARAECFRQANAAAQSQVGMASANPAAAAEGNAVGADAYYACIRRAGLRR